MPRRKISQREAHTTAQRAQVLTRRLHDLRCPTEYDVGFVAKIRPLPVDERMRGYLEGLATGRRMTLAARLTEAGIVLYAFEEVDNG